MHIAVTAGAAIVATPSGDVGNLLQITAGAHRLDLKLDYDLRPLARAGLAASRQVAVAARMLSAANCPNLTRSMS